MSRQLPVISSMAVRAILAELLDAWCKLAGMVMEKQAVFARAWMGMFGEGIRLQQQPARSLFTGETPLQHAARAKSAASRMASTGLAPIHRKAVANAKRLARTKLR